MHVRPRTDGCSLGPQLSGNPDFSSFSNRFIERSRELRSMAPVKKQIGLNTVQAALAFKSEGRKGHMKRVMLKMQGNMRKSDDDQATQEEVDDIAASAKKMHSAVITTVGLMKFAKPTASFKISRDASPHSMRHYTLAEMGGKGNIWQSHLRQKKKILKRLLEDGVEPDHAVKDWLTGQNDVRGPIHSARSISQPLLSPEVYWSERSCDPCLMCSLT